MFIYTSLLHYHVTLYYNYKTVNVIYSCGYLYIAGKIREKANKK